tara:strand:- start:2109 stop:2231 length:123 start_codon:yes stop_codon:yes gene_type:complete
MIGRAGRPQFDNEGKVPSIRMAYNPTFLVSVTDIRIVLLH